MNKTTIPVAIRFPAPERRGAGGTLPGTAATTGSSLTADQRHVDFHRIQLLETGNRRRDSEGLNGKYKELQKEYDAYKRRASDALKHKDAAIKRALEQDGGHGGHHNKRSGMRDGVGGLERGGHERGGPRVLPKNPTTEYLKNTIIQYMATEQIEVKEHMEAAIATVLQFTREDVQFLKQKRDEAQGWLGSTVSGFFG